MFLANFSTKEKIGLLIGMLFVFSALLDRLVVSPINSRFNQINHEVKMSEKQLAMELRNLDQKEAVQKEYQKHAQHHQNKGLDEEKITSVLTSIEDLARESGISVLNIKPQQPRSVDFYKEYSVAMEAEGEMAALMNFFYKLNISPQLLRMETLDLNLKAEDSKIIKALILITRTSVP